MDYVINLWTSTPQNIQNQIFIISTLLIPTLIVILCNYELIEIIIGAFAFITPLCLD
ncbi:MAG: hypothetical protein RLZZ171_2898, partial [Cyanobacteriota bacterium]